jgi:Enoyl-(Acyl carrier protein) reductase
VAFGLIAVDAKTIPREVFWRFLGWSAAAITRTPCPQAGGACVIDDLSRTVSPLAMARPREFDRELALKGIALGPRAALDNRQQCSARAYGDGMTVDHLEMVKSLAPLGRVGQPREIAGLVAYLASEESAYMTAPA